MQSKGKAWIFGAAGAGVALLAMIGAVMLMSTAPEAKAASCGRGMKPAVIGGNFRCLRVGQRCSARYQGAYRRYSFHCSKGRLRRGTGLSVTAAPSQATPPPPPAPTPAAVDGHYKGMTSQNETFEFDIVNGGLTFKGLKTGQINQGCTPPGHIYGNYFNWPDYTVLVSLAGEWAIDGDLTGGYVGPWPAATHLTIHGHMSGQAGTGNLELRRSYTNGSTGISYTCDSGLVSWTVTRTS